MNCESSSSSATPVGEQSTSTPNRQSPMLLPPPPPSTSSSSGAVSRSTTPVSIVSCESGAGSVHFVLADFAFHLLHKLCTDYATCRAELGRIGGLGVYIARAESALPQTTTTTTSDDINKSSNKSVEIICLCCKEAVNRMRLREQGLLVNLIRLQQRLSRVSATTTPSPTNNHKEKVCSTADNSAWRNKLLVALCCFVHDADSMSILLANGLVDSLLAYVRESVADAVQRASSSSSSSSTTSRGVSGDELLQLFDMAQGAAKSLRLEQILSFSSSNAINNDETAKRKRKASLTAATTVATIESPTNATSSKKRRRNKTTALDNVVNAASDQITVTAAASPHSTLISPPPPPPLFPLPPPPLPTPSMATAAYSPPFDSFSTSSSECKCFAKTKTRLNLVHFTHFTHSPSTSQRAHATATATAAAATRPRLDESGKRELAQFFAADERLPFLG